MKSPHKPFFQSEEGRTSTPVRRSQITHLSIHPTPVSTLRETHPSRIQNKVLFSPDIQLRHSTDTFTHAQRRQSAQMFSTEETTGNSTYGINPRQLSASNWFQEMFHSSGNTERGRNEEFVITEEPPSGSPPSSDGRSSRSSTASNRKIPTPSQHCNRARGPPGQEPPSGSGFSVDSSDSESRDKNVPSIFRRIPKSTINLEAHFDIKMKANVIPRWDGHPDTLAKWILKLNHLAERGSCIFNQLGQLVPTHFEKEADSWFWSLPLSYRNNAMKDWGTLHEVICSYFMNRA